METTIYSKLVLHRSTRVTTIVTTKTLKALVTLTSSFISYYRHDQHGHLDNLTCPSWSCQMFSRKPSQHLYHSLQVYASPSGPTPTTKS